MSARTLSAALVVSAAAALFPACGEAPAQGVTSDAHASACASCHSSQADAWSTSRHAQSGASPVFQAMQPLVAAAWGEDARARCVACHTPGHGGDDGIGCVACHAATGNERDGDGKLIVDLKAPLAGPFGDAQPTAAHGSRKYDFLTAPELCGTCHEVTGPHLFVEPTLGEYRASPAAASGATCQSCHLPAIDPAPIADGTTNARPRVDHSFAGIDPPWGASDVAAADAATRTKTLLASAIGLGAGAADDGGVDVTIANAAGHAVPTGAAFLRRIWIDVTYTDSSGAHADVARVIELGAIPTKNGAPVALVTDADAVASNVLAPGATEKTHVPPPATLAKPTHAKVTLRAQAIDPGVLAALGLSARASEAPVHDVRAIDVVLGAR